MIKLKDFCDLTYKEKLMVLDWRNDISVRKCMFTSDIIKKENHLGFIDKLRNSKSEKYFLVFKSENPIGVIYFTNIKNNSNVCDLGLYSNPNIKGVGDILLKEIINFAFKELNKERLLAEVYKNNIKAINLYKRFNFFVIDDNKDFLIMELKNES